MGQGIVFTLVYYWLPQHPMIAVVWVSLEVNHPVFIWGIAPTYRSTLVNNLSVNKWPGIPAGQSCRSCWPELTRSVQQNPAAGLDLLTPANCRQQFSLKDKLHLWKITPLMSSNGLLWMALGIRYHKAKEHLVLMAIWLNPHLLISFLSFITNCTWFYTGY